MYVQLLFQLIIGFHEMVSMWINHGV